MNVQARHDQVVVVVLLVDEPRGQFARVVVVDERDDGHLLPGGIDRLFADQTVADQVADRLAPRRVALGRAALVKRFEESIFQRNADARKFRHGRIPRQVRLL